VSSVSILDASAVLAYLQEEKGYDRVEAALDAGLCWLTTVNMCEVLGRLCDHAMPPEEARAAVDDLGVTIVNFDAVLAAQAAFLRIRTNRIGASLGDRACLALAEQASGTGARPVVYTAEKAWTRLTWAFKLVVIR
jgi:ribonuclease VapC